MSAGVGDGHRSRGRVVGIGDARIRECVHLGESGVLARTLVGLVGITRRPIRVRRVRGSPELGRDRSDGVARDRVVHRVGRRRCRCTRVHHHDSVEHGFTGIDAAGDPRGLHGQIHRGTAVFSARLVEGEPVSRRYDHQGLLVVVAARVGIRHHNGDVVVAAVVECDAVTAGRVIHPVSGRITAHCCRGHNRLGGRIAVTRIPESVVGVGVEPLVCRNRRDAVIREEVVGDGLQTGTRAGVLRNHHAVQGGFTRVRPRRDPLALDHDVRRYAGGNRDGVSGARRDLGEVGRTGPGWGHTRDHDRDVLRSVVVDGDVVPVDGVVHAIGHGIGADGVRGHEAVGRIGVDRVPVEVSRVGVAFLDRRDGGHCSDRY